MATIRQSIDIKVPVHAAFNQLTRFEDYPLFMDEVKTVQKLDDTHLHWTTIMANRPVEWDAEITEQEPDRCIAWHNMGGPTNAGRVELQPVGQDASRVTFTLHTEPEQVPGSMAGNSEQELALRLKLDLARMKDFIEGGGAEPGMPNRASGQSAGQQEGMAESTQDDRGSPRNSPVPMAAYGAGSEGFSGDEEPASPVTSASRTAAEQRNDSAGSARPAVSSVSSSISSTGSGAQQQSGTMRHLGQMPQDTSAESHGGTPTSDAMGKPLQPGQQNMQGSAGSTAAADAGDTSSVPREGTTGAAGGTASGGTGSTKP